MNMLQGVKGDLSHSKVVVLDSVSDIGWILSCVILHIVHPFNIWNSGSKYVYNF